MTALGRVPTPAAVAAMQSINVVVINPWCLGAFLGTAVLAPGTAVLALAGGGGPWGVWFLAGSACYLAGTYLVTVLGNVPLNRRLAGGQPADPATAALWARYRRRWTRLNHLRTASALAAALLFSLGVTGVPSP